MTRDRVGDIDARTIRHMEATAEAISKATPEQLAELVAWNNAVDRERREDAESILDQERRKVERRSRPKRLPRHVRYITLREDEL
jgi:hypothetical protein